MLIENEIKALWKAIKCIRCNTKPTYIVYRAILNQSGTSAPVATILENSLGTVPVWNYNSTGNYQTSGFNFDVTKTLVIIGSASPANLCQALIASNNLYVLSMDGVSHSAADNRLSNTSIEIIIYP